MSRQTTWLFSLAVAVSMIGTARTWAQHDESHLDPPASRHVDSVAHEVEQAANSLAWELYRNHRSHHDYRTVYRETKEMWAVARHCHDLLHNKINNDRLKKNVVELDELFHHLEGHLQSWDQTYHARPSHGWHDYAVDNHGHEYSPEHRLLGLAANLERSLHHLMEDVGVERREFPNAPVVYDDTDVLPPNE